jgi:phospholipase C
MNIRTLILAVAAAIGEAAISQANGTPAVNAFTHIVVIYQENHSFDNLYGLWGKVNGAPSTVWKAPIRRTPCRFVPTTKRGRISVSCRPT